MKKQLLCLLFGALTFPYLGLGQNTHELPCGTRLDSADLELMNRVEPYIQQRIEQHKNRGDAPELLLYIPVKFYLIRKSDGSGGSNVNISSLLSSLNSKFNGTGFYFQQCGAAEDVDNDNFYNFKYALENSLLATAYTPGVLNLYLVNSIDYVSQYEPGGRGYSYTPVQGAKDIAVFIYSAVGSSTVPHEVGHYFGLEHTHGPTPNGSCPAMAGTDELVNKCNCTTAGDRVCDTPPDPGLRYGQGCADSLYSMTNNNTCVYTGNSSIKDINDQPYNPAMNNIMNYAYFTCRTTFTPGQKDRMVAQYYQYRAYLACPQDCHNQFSVYATDVTHNAAKIRWTSSSLKIHEIQVKNSGGAWSTVGLAPSSGTYAQIDNLTPGASYNNRMRVKVSCAGAEGAPFWKICNAFSTLSACNIPTSLITSNIGPSYALFSWAAVSGAKDYTVEIRAAGTDYWVKSVTTAGTSLFFQDDGWGNIYSNGGLASNTPYEWRVRANCSNGLYSDWSAPKPFTTLSTSCNSPAIAQLVLIDAGSTYITVKCTAPGVSFKFRKRRLYGGQGGFQVSNFSSNIHFINNLDPCTTYEVQCQVKCQSGGSYSQASASQFFTTTGCSPCNPPAVMTTASTTDNSAVLNWSSVTGAWSYSIQYQLSAGPWTDLSPGTFSGTSATMYNLQAGSPYKWRIRANCSNGLTSAWSAATPANTKSVCPKPRGLKAIVDAPNPTKLLWEVVSGISAYELEYGPAGATWQSVTAGAGALGVQLPGLTPGTTYGWRLRTKCGANLWSEWVLGPAFTTFPSPSLALGQSSQNVGFNAGSTAITVISNIGWTATVKPGATWLTLQCSASGQNNGSLTASFELNNSTSARTGTITVTGSGITKTVTIVQAGNPDPNCSNDNEPANNTQANAPTIALNTEKRSQIAPAGDQDNWAFTLASPQNTTVNLTNVPADYDLKVFNSAGVQIGISTGSNLSNESVPLGTLAAGTYYARVYGYLNANSATQCYTLKIVTAAPNTLTVLPATKNVGAAAGSETFSITSNGTWSAAENATWLSISPANGSNNGTLTASFQANTGSSARTATITVTGTGGLSQTVSLTQTGSNYLSVSPAAKNVTAAAGNETFSVVSNLFWAASDNASWCTVSPVIGSNDALVTVAFSANLTPSARVATITLSGSGLTQTVTLTQTGAAPDCGTPATTETQNITQNTATFLWAAVPGAVSYQVQYFWGSDWVNLGGPTTSLSTGVYGLVPNYSYTWRVFAICANNQQGTPSSPVSFSTPTTPNCAGGTQWPAGALTPTANWQYQTNIYGGEYSVVNVQSGVTYTFSYCVSDNASLAFDGELSIRTADDYLLAYNNNFCGIAPKIVWQSAFTGQIRVLLTKNTCQTQPTASTMAYRVGNSFSGDNSQVRSEEAPQIGTWPPVPRLAHMAAETTPAPEATQMSLSIYPNPTSGKFHIDIAAESPDGIADVQVYDFLGRLIWSGTRASSLAPGSHHLEIDASMWANGIYDVRVSAAGGQQLFGKIQVLNK